LPLPLLTDLKEIGTGFAVYTNPTAPNEPEKAVLRRVIGTAKSEVGEFYPICWDPLVKHYRIAQEIDGFLGLTFDDVEAPEDEEDEGEDDEDAEDEDETEEVTELE
jgi:hypothetical protein